MFSLRGRLANSSRPCTHVVEAAAAVGVTGVRRLGVACKGGVSGARHTRRFDTRPPRPQKHPASRRAQSQATVDGRGTEHCSSTVTYWRGKTALLVTSSPCRC